MIDSDEITDYNPLPGGNNDVIIDSKQKALLLALREALLLMLAAVEIYLNLPKTKLKKERSLWESQERIIIMKIL